MKRLGFTILFLIGLLATSFGQEIKSYEEGVLLWGGFDIIKQEVVGELGKKADIIRLEKSKDKYTIYGKDLDGSLVKVSFKKLKGFNEEGKYVDENGDVYYIKDLLDTPVKTFDAVNTRPLPDIPPNIFMILRVYIK